MISYPFGAHTAASTVRDSNEKPPTNPTNSFQEFDHDQHSTRAVQQPSTRFGIGRWALEDEGGRPYLVVRTLQTFCSFVALCIYIAIVAHQSKYSVGPSFLGVLGLIVNLFTLTVSALCLTAPLMADKWSIMASVERVMTQVRFSSLSAAGMVGLLFIMCIASTVSCQVGGCSDPTKDPHADNEAYINTLDLFCRNKSAGATFFWFQLFAWLTLLGLVLLKWSYIRKNPITTKFNPPTSFTYGQNQDEEAFDPRDELNPFDQQQDRTRPLDYRTNEYDQTSKTTYQDDLPPDYGRQHGNNDDGYHHQTEVRDPFDNSRDAELNRHDPYERIRKSMEHTSQTLKY
ncbi:hypothetical protein OIO90_005537 [Microbotryomycetes sp. JL221]|nr:hypothetical protein OIO90_005537 [Microbotryomycetes sp. JL221]